MKVERIRKAIPGGTARKLWVKAGGRCEYDGCNISLWKDSLTQQNMNKAYISHIVAASAKGPRGDKTESPKLELEYSNLLLLCDECHNRIDEAQPKEHPVEWLQKMKKDHESRIELLTSLTINKRSHIILYGAKIGTQQVPLNFAESAHAMLPDRFPVSDAPIEIGVKNSSYEDSVPEYWQYQASELTQTFQQKVGSIKGNHEVQHFSVFALAPQPLLIKLGTLLSEIYHADIYQRHREPATWKWQDDAIIKEFELIQPENKTGTPALVYSLSAKVTDDRIQSVLGKNCSIWKITIKTPDRDFLKTKELLSKFRTISRTAFDEIKSHYGSKIQLNIFPAMPVSAAVEVGRIWMPKADMPLIIYDENTAAGGFIKTIEIKNQ